MQLRLRVLRHQRPKQLSSYMRMASGPISKAGQEKENTYGPRRAKVARATTVFETQFNTSRA